MFLLLIVLKVLEALLKMQIEFAEKIVDLGKDKSTSSETSLMNGLIDVNKLPEHHQDKVVQGKKRLSECMDNLAAIIEEELNDLTNGNDNYLKSLMPHSEYKMDTDERETLKM